MSVHAIREKLGCGLYEAKKLHKVSKLLDDVEGATDVYELRRSLSEFITMQTGVE
jgi:hypothetical protein